jgi:hypothetical protein
VVPFDSFLAAVVLLVFLLASIRVSASVPNPVLRADSFFISLWFWLSQKGGASDRIRDIGRVSSRNFD